MLGDVVSGAVVLPGVAELGLCPCGVPCVSGVVPGVVVLPGLLDVPGVGEAVPGVGEAVPGVGEAVPGWLPVVPLCPGLEVVPEF